MCENCLESDYLCRKVYLICIIQVLVCVRETRRKWLKWWNNLIFICTGGWVWFGWQGSLLALSHLIVSVSSFSSKNRNTSLLVFIIREVSAHKVTPTPTFTTNINFAIWQPGWNSHLQHSQHSPTILTGSSHRCSNDGSRSRIKLRLKHVINTPDLSKRSAGFYNFTCHIFTSHLICSSSLFLKPVEIVPIFAWFWYERMKVNLLLT